jgi:hypothetical protein
MGGAGVTVEAHGSTVVRHDLEDDGGNSALVCPFFCCGKQHPSDAPPESGKKEKTRAEIVGNSGDVRSTEKKRGREGEREAGRRERKGTRCACVRSSAAYIPLIRRVNGHVRDEHGAGTCIDRGLDIIIPACAQYQLLEVDSPDHSPMLGLPLLVHDRLLLPLKVLLGHPAEGEELAEVLYFDGLGRAAAAALLHGCCGHDAPTASSDSLSFN